MISEQQLEILGQLRSGGNIQPLPSIAVQRFAFKDGDVAVLEVQPSDLPLKTLRWSDRSPSRGSEGLPR